MPEAYKETRRKAEQDYEKGRRHEPVSRKRSVSRLKALKKEPASSVSHAALSRQAKEAARERTASERSGAARKAARTREHHKSSRGGKLISRRYGKSFQYNPD